VRQRCCREVRSTLRVRGLAPNAERRPRGAPRTAIAEPRRRMRGRGLWYGRVTPLARLGGWEQGRGASPGWSGSGVWCRGSGECEAEEGAAEQADEADEARLELE
jgi:hypothetical protein